MKDSVARRQSGVKYELYCVSYRFFERKLSGNFKIEVQNGKMLENNLTKKQNEILLFHHLVWTSSGGFSRDFFSLTYVKSLRKVAGIAQSSWAAAFNGTRSI